MSLVLNCYSGKGKTYEWRIMKDIVLVEGKNITWNRRIKSFERTVNHNHITAVQIYHSKYGAFN